MWGCGVVICQDDADDDEVWFANENGVLPPIAVPHTEDSTHKKMYELTGAYNSLLRNCPLLSLANSLKSEEFIQDFVTLNIFKSEILA
jgi:hypothetical protein